MAQKYTGTDKKVSKMTKEGLREENLRDGSVSDISSKSRDRPTEDLNVSSKQKQKRMKKYDGKFREQGMIPEDSTITSQKESIKKKKKADRLVEEQAKSGKLAFDDIENQMVKGAGAGFGRKTAGAVTKTTSAYAHEKLHQEADDNAAVEGIHSGEIALEASTEHLRKTQLKSRRSDVKANRKGYRMDEVPESKSKFEI